MALRFSRHWSTACARRAAVVLVVTGLATFLPGPSPTGAARASLSPAAGRFFALGYLWGDGHPTSDGWRFTSCQRASADRFADSVRALGAAAHRFRGRAVCGHDRHRRYGVRADHLHLEVNQPGMPPALVHADVKETREFLVGVVEGEGNAASGLVLDDPSAARADVMTKLMKRASVATTRKSTGDTAFFWVYAVKSDWPNFTDWPWASCARVPGHYCTAHR